MSQHAGDSSNVEGEALLESLGYKQELNRAVSVLGSIALVVSDITPTASLLVIGPVVLATAGSGALWAYIIGCFIAINVALCMGELGSMFPVAGGLYSIVTRVLGRPVGFLALLDYIGQAIFLPASVAIGIGVYVQALNPDIPSNIAAAAVMVLATVVAILRINLNARITAVFLLIELVVVTVLALAGLTHFQQPLSILTSPVLGDGSAVGIGLVFTAVAVAMFSVNGYDSAINFSEETTGSAVHVGQAVVRAALIGIGFELVPFILIVFGAPNLSAFLGSTTPLTDVARSAFGDTFVNILTYGAILAIFNAALAITLQFARIVWSSGRDRAWPAPISDSKRLLLSMAPIRDRWKRSNVRAPSLAHTRRRTSPPAPDAHWTKHSTRTASSMKSRSIPERAIHFSMTPVALTTRRRPQILGSESLRSSPSSSRRTAKPGV